uniref:Uncharacterized protein n=1 Tax=viral metagenome TaxID=1070528 RepID=A0A6C0JUN8_9ZZZZ
MQKAIRENRLGWLRENRDKATLSDLFYSNKNGSLEATWIIFNSSAIKDLLYERCGHKFTEEELGVLGYDISVDAGIDPRNIARLIKGLQT